MSSGFSFNDYRKAPRTSRPCYFVVEGRWGVEALLASELEIRSILFVGDQHRDLEATIPSSLPTARRPKEEVEEISGFKFHRGVLASAKRPHPRSAASRVSTGCWVICPEIADESNLGAIVRNVAALGAQGVIVDASRGADVYGRKSIRASAGALFRVPVIESQDLRADVVAIRKDGCRIIGASLSCSASLLHQVPCSKTFALLLGNEGNGLGEEWLELCDYQVKIPMSTGMDSLNVASSSAILLYELCQRAVKAESPPTPKSE